LDLDKEKAFFDSFESNHGDYDVLREDSYQRILSVFQKERPFQPGMSCVDLGCGTGAFTRRLSALGLASTGVDISSRSIDRANALGGGAFVVGDMAGCSLPSSSFDYAVMSGALHHVPTRTDRVRSLREAHRLLKPGGRFFSYDPNGFSPSMWLYRDPRSPLYSSAGKTDNEILLTRHQLEEELRDAGFADIKVRGLSGITYRYVEGRLAQRMLPIYNGVYEPMIRCSGLEKYLGTFLVAMATKGGQ
jgi:SAM-dependent methyltransferase